ncbi:uncharacterized protein LOC112975576 [Apteryx rowi]|uniref:uncharacterized protein LOC112975576 n=1 Tax=Apteryx rowi TaxID=308060 RepID=UPI000E1DA616|nr:uncharacterized protein LOC112975576 [Apteryx rowi]
MSFAKQACRQRNAVLPLLEILNALTGGDGGSGESSHKLGSHLRILQVLSAADKRGGRWGDFEGEELRGSNAYVVHHPVSPQVSASQVGHGLGTIADTHGKENLKRDSEIITVYFSNDVKVCRSLGSTSRELLAINTHLAAFPRTIASCIGRATMRSCRGESPVSTGERGEPRAAEPRPRAVHRREKNSASRPFPHTPLCLLKGAQGALRANASYCGSPGGKSVATHCSVNYGQSQMSTEASRAQAGFAEQPCPSLIPAGLAPRGAVGSGCPGSSPCSPERQDRRYERRKRVFPGMLQSIS